MTSNAAAFSAKYFVHIFVSFVLLARSSCCFLCAFQCSGKQRGRQKTHLGIYRCYTSLMLHGFMTASNLGCPFWAGIQGRKDSIAFTGYLMVTVLATVAVSVSEFLCSSRTGHIIRYPLSSEAKHSWMTLNTKLIRWTMKVVNWLTTWRRPYLHWYFPAALFAKLPPGLKLPGWAFAKSLVDAKNDMVTSSEKTGVMKGSFLIAAHSHLRTNSWLPSHSHLRLRWCCPWTCRLHHQSSPLTGHHYAICVAFWWKLCWILQAFFVT